MSAFKYVGQELELFARVYNWKSYWSARIRPFIKGDVVEVGAGLGANTPYLNRGDCRSWICLEPDPALVEELAANTASISAACNCEIKCGTLQSLEGRQFDTIVYIDVLEHIEDDKGELQRAARLLRSGGRVIVLSPAHQFLFTDFDAAIGHYRRYNRSSLANLSPPALDLEQMWYLDSAGLLLSAANRLLLRQSMPTEAQLKVWDQWVIPVSRVLDRCLFGRVGKSIVEIWRKKD